MRADYEIVIGLEVHVELSTKTKIFCSCPTHFGAPPNTLCCPVCAGLPGALPTLNEEAVKKAIKAGIALNCAISEHSAFDRKNYFYPDLPKAYQITQFYSPICRGGHVEIDTENGIKQIGITEIHLEEDAGKLTHSGNSSFIDLNRCGVPLIEIVSEPDMRSADEAKEYLRRLRTLLLYAEVSDCKMNEGSMRCDVNISVRKLGDKTLGTRTELKNINSISFVGKAIEYEAQRQISLLEKGCQIVRETRRFDAQSGKTYSMRAKEDADDYRYFPEPDLPPLILEREWIETIKKELPTFPDERKKQYSEKYSLSPNETAVLVSDKAIADYFESAAEQTKYPKALANFIVTDLLSLQETEELDFKITPSHLASLSDLFGSDVINSSSAKKLLLEMWESDIDPEIAVKERGLAQINDTAILSEIVNKVITENPKAVEDYKNGKKAASKTIIGLAMKATAGKANPKILTTLAEAILNEK